jgi:hypothetical protein
MVMPKLMGFCALIPATVLVTISFFVLVVLRKIEAGALKIFGYVVTVILWIVAFLVFSAGIYMVSGGHQCMMQGKMHEMMQGRMPKMMQEKREMWMQQKGKTAGMPCGENQTIPEQKK